MRIEIKPERLDRVLNTELNGSNSKTSWPLVLSEVVHSRDSSCSSPQFAALISTRETKKGCLFEIGTSAGRMGCR